jgi:predicted dinucleotide-binding enzyme
MRIGIIGSGVVGQALGGALVERGEDVLLGTRSPKQLDEKRGMGGSLRDWLDTTKQKGRLGTFAEAAAHGEVLINATSGTGALEALKLAGEKNLDGKILIDVSNPLDFSKGFPPSLTVCNTDSLGEQIQRAFPKTKVVKALNTVSNPVMINPGSVGNGDHDLFICGNDNGAKARVTELLKKWFGWKSIVDVGDISNARGTEMLLPLWVRLYGKYQSPMFNFRIMR